MLLEPAPAAPLGLDEPELDGEVLDEDEEAPPLAWSFFWMSTEVDEELEPEGGVVLGAAVVPEAELDDEGAVLGEAVEPEGEVLDEPAGPRFSPRSQPASAAAPNARETARANVETFMWPPWLGYVIPGARIGPRLLRRHPPRLINQFFIVGALSLLFGPAWSPSRWKSRCCSACLGST